jgi:hypothetical protein
MSVKFCAQKVQRRRYGASAFWDTAPSPSRQSLTRLSTTADAVPGFADVQRRHDLPC